jgi:O-antigen/teichoic acid export membrane protein
MNYHLVALVVRDRVQAHDALARRYQALGLLVIGGFAATSVPAIRPAAICVAAGAAMAALPTGALLAARATFWAACALVGPNLVFLLLILVLPEYDADGAMIAWIFANVAVLVLLWRGVAWVRPKRRPNVGLWALHRRSLSLAIFNLAVLAYGRIDTVLMAVLVGSAAAGVYGTCYRVVLSTVGLASWSANIAAKRLGDGRHRQAELVRLIRFTAISAIVVAFGLVVFLEPAVGLLLGRSVAIPTPALLALAALPVPLMITNPITYFVVIGGHQRQLAMAAAVAGAVAAVLYPFAIKAFGISGGALSALTVELLGLCLFARVARCSVRTAVCCP